MPPPLSASLVAVVSIIAGELESFFRDEGCQGGVSVQRREPFRGAGIQAGTLGGARIVGHDAGVPVVMEAGERKGVVNQAGCPNLLPGVSVISSHCSLISEQRLSHLLHSRKNAYREGV
jgi:hypothetical protein